MREQRSTACFAESIKLFRLPSKNVPPVRDFASKRAEKKKSFLLIVLPIQPKINSSGRGILAFKDFRHNPMDVEI